MVRCPMKNLVSKFAFVLLMTVVITVSSPMDAVAAEASPAKTFAVVPFAALSGDVPQRSGNKAAGMLATELKNAEGLAPAGGKKPPVAEPNQEGIARAKNAVDEA